MKIIKFVKPAGIYSTGDEAGFADPIADEYVKRGVAEPVEAKKKQAKDDKAE